MIKIELHVHSLGGSYCAKASAAQIAARLKNEGYGGVMITNHYNERSFMIEYAAKDFKSKMDYYCSLFDEVKAECEKVGLKAFFGAEVAVKPCGTEYVIVGFDREFLYNHDYLFKLTQEQLFELADKNGLFMYQPHTARHGVKFGNPKFMHGAEWFNSHLHHNNHNALAENFCKENNLIKVSGNDFHVADQPLIGGALIPNRINDEKQLAEYLKSGKCKMYKDEIAYQQALKWYMEEGKN